MKGTSRGHAAHPARWLLALTLGAALAVAPSLAAAPPAHAATTPVAVNDAYSTIQGTSFTSSPGVMANDDLGGESLNWDVKVLPSHGSATTGADYPNFVYTPSPGFSGTDSFQYCLNRLAGFECLSNLATVTITVEAGKAADDQFSTSVGVPLKITASMITANDPSGSEGKLSWKNIDEPKHGLMAYGSSSGGLEATYSPAAGFVGVDAFT